LEKLLLSEEGVFPVKKDVNGTSLKKMPNTGMSVAGTVQGEGMLAGTPSLFIRLAGCNLRCIWSKGHGEYSICDTSGSVFGQVRTIPFTIDSIVELTGNNLGNIRHVVITGGEPMLQAKQVAVLCRELKKRFDVHITMETNGTLFDRETAREIDLFSISPKLSGTNPDAGKLRVFGLKQTDIHRNHDSKRINIRAVQSFIDVAAEERKDFQLKFVVTKPEDADEIKRDFLSRLTGWTEKNIFVMPLGATKEELRIFTPVALEMAISNGWRFSPRMHIELFNENTGV